MPRQDLIPLRRGTRAGWGTENSILAAGEPGFETDTYVLKIGDGSSQYADLPAINRLTNLPDTYRLIIRPTLDQARVSAVSKPTAVTVGVFQAYSMPIWNETTNVEEELYYRFTVPEQLDGVTDPILTGYNYITNVEDVGDKFKFEFGYNCADCDDGALTDTVYNVYDEATIVTDHTAQYSPYCLMATLDASHIIADGIFAGRVRRVASAGPEVANEIAVMYITITFPVDKIYSPWV